METLFITAGSHAHFLGLSTGSISYLLKLGPIVILCVMTRHGYLLVARIKLSYHSNLSDPQMPSNAPNPQATVKVVA